MMPRASTVFTHVAAPIFTLPQLLPAEPRGHEVEISVGHTLSLSIDRGGQYGAAPTL